MNKNHLILLTLGLGGCLALTLMMGHLLKMNPEVKANGPLAQQFAARFGSLLEKAPYLVIKKQESEDGMAVADDGLEIVARVHPKPTTDVDEMIVAMGDFLWKSAYDGGTPRSVMIRWRDPRTGELSRTRLMRPGGRPVLRLYGTGSGGAGSRGAASGVRR